jgi:DNA-binding MarR family transcriptional regulator
VSTRRHDGSLYYLLKHAQLRLADLTGPALAPFGINGRECAVLIAIDEQAPPSQHDIAQRMGVDRTTMVNLVDELEAKGLVERRPDLRDRRKNVVALTEAGRVTLQGATEAADQAERSFLGALSDEQAATFRELLRVTVLAASAGPAGPAEPAGGRR